MFIPEQHRAYPNRTTGESNIAFGSLQSAQSVKIRGASAREKDLGALGVLRREDRREAQFVAENGRMPRFGIGRQQGTLTPERIAWF
jgi:hypothetical protein